MPAHTLVQKAIIATRIFTFSTFIVLTVRDPDAGIS